MKTPTIHQIKEGKRTVNAYSYCAVLCEKEGSRVLAIRYDGYRNKHDLMKYVWEQFPGWNIKAVHKLYDDDFGGDAR